MYSIVKAEPAHLQAIAANIRQQDLNEIWAAAALLPLDALKMSLENADYAKTALIHGEPICIWGVDDGVIWMIATDRIEKHRRVFLQESRRELALAQTRYGELYNWVDARNTKAVRWLKWLGFEVEAAKPYGLMGKPFHYFSWQKREARAA